MLVEAFTHPIIPTSTSTWVDGRRALDFGSKVGRSIESSIRTQAAPCRRRIDQSNQGAPSLTLPHTRTQTPSSSIQLPPQGYQMTYAPRAQPSQPLLAPRRRVAGAAAGVDAPSIAVPLCRLCVCHRVGRVKGETPQANNTGGVQARCCGGWMPKQPRRETKPSKRASPTLLAFADL